MAKQLEWYDFTDSGSHSLEEWADDLIRLRDKYKDQNVDVFLDGDTIMIYEGEDAN